MSESNRYWDYVATQADKHENHARESFTDLIKVTFPDLVTYVDQIFWVNGAVLYMNSYLGIPQRKIGKLLGLSQFGVSKRFRSSKSKLKLTMSRPYQSIDALNRILNRILPKNLVEPLVQFHFIGVMSMVIFLGNCSTSSLSTSTKIKTALNIIKKLDEMNSLDEINRFFNKLKLSPVTPEEFDGLKNNIHKLNEFYIKLKDSKLYGNFSFRKNNGIRFKGDPYELFGFEED
jgi:predicted transcriptional regulator